MRGTQESDSQGSWEAQKMTDQEITKIYREKAEHGDAMSAIAYALLRDRDDGDHLRDKLDGVLSAMDAIYNQIGRSS